MVILLFHVTMCWILSICSLTFRLFYIKNWYSKLKSTSNICAYVHIYWKNWW